MDEILLISILGFVILFGMTLLVIEEFSIERRVILAEYRRGRK
ncbi:hypothetical protein NIES4106_54340 (plasmid) [Fischerella sp. NIES-4106]|jgi:hypothetical protein|nr:hypothetical protein NIES4106_54340 [Fischerella sp. NIES-4106]